jgi:ATP-dependent DNA helicase RecQ
MLKVLDVDGAVRRVEGGWVTTGTHWRHDTARYERIAAARTAEQNEMLKYIATTECRMEFLRRCLDDPAAVPCGRCDNCSGPFVSKEVSREAFGTAQAHFARVGVEITPRTMWPTGLPAIGVALSGRIPGGERALAGYVVARLTDLGWGEQLRQLLDDGTVDREVPDEILQGAVRVLKDWTRGEGHQPVGMIAIESQRRPILIRSFTRGITAICKLPLLGTLPVIHAGPSARQANSARRVAALHGAFAVSADLASACGKVPGPVLLVDDLVDSRWTMTLAARALRRAGVVKVLPFALASTGRGE